MKYFSLSQYILGAMLFDYKSSVASVYKSVPHEQSVTQCYLTSTVSSIGLCVPLVMNCSDYLGETVSRVTLLNTILDMDIVKVQSAILRYVEKGDDPTKSEYYKGINLAKPRRAPRL